MSNPNFNDLPFELQYQIINNLYPSWWLIAEEINAYNATAICKITSSRRLQSSPLFVCRSMHKAALLALSSQFTGTLYAAPTRTPYSIIPKFKRFLANVTNVVMDQSQPLLEMSQLYAQRLPALRTIEVISYVTYPVMRTIAEKYTLEQVLHSDIADADLARVICTPEVRRTKIIREASSFNPGLQYLYQQGFPLDPADTIVFVTFNLSVDPIQVVRKFLVSEQLEELDLYDNFRSIPPCYWVPLARPAIRSRREL